MPVSFMSWSIHSPLSDPHSSQSLTLVQWSICLEHATATGEQWQWQWLDAHHPHASLHAYTSSEHIRGPPQLMTYRGNDHGPL